MARKNSENIKEQEARVDRLNEAAIKSSTQNAKNCQLAFAASMYFALQHGRCHKLNALFNGLSLADKQAMRSFAVPRMLELFGTDGEKTVRDDGTEVWVKRPTPIISFKAKPETEGQHFALVPLGENSSLKGERLEAAKATKRAILAAGEEALVFDWVKPGQVFRDATYNDEAFTKDIRRILKKAAENAYNIGSLSRNDILAIARAAGLRTGEITDILKVYTPAPSNNNQPEETVPNMGAAEEPAGEAEQAAAA